MPDPVVNPAPVAPAQPAPAAEPQAQSAVHAAVTAGDTAKFREARRAERIGKPLPEVPVTPAPAPEATTDVAEPPAAPAPPAVSKRQQQINDYERRIAEQDQRIRALESQVTRPAAPAQSQTHPAQPPEPAQATWQDVVRAPDVSREMVSESQFFEQFPDAPYAAYGAYVSRYFTAAEHQQAQARAHDEQLTASQQKRVETFVGRLEAARASDPEFVNKLTPEVRALKPFGALLPGEPSGPLNVVAEQVYDSPIADKVLLHFSQHPEALRRLQSLPPEIAALPPAQRVRAHTQWIVREFGRIEARLEPIAPPAAPVAQTLTAAPEPAQTLGTRPAEATDPKAGAIKRGDTSAYRAIRRQERAAAMRR